MQMDVMTALYKLEGEKQFDYILWIHRIIMNWKKVC